MAERRDPFWELLEPEHPRVRAYCRRLAGNREDGDDLCQEALVAAFQRFESLRDTERFRPWLYRIVVNRYRNARRGSFWRRFVPAAGGNEVEAAGADPNDVHEAGRLLERAFVGIGSADRALLVLFETEGWSAGELGQLLGISEAATRVRLCRIRMKMRKALARHAARVAKRHRSTVAVREERLCIVTKPNAD